MVIASLRVCAGRGLNTQVLNLGDFQGLPAVFVQKCNITSKAYRTEDPSKPKPWPYREKTFTRLHSLIDRASKRFDENSKVIVVEGPVAAGKTAFAKTLAQELDMLHVPEANMDLRFINPYGYDMRQLDSKLSEDNPMRSFDEKNFLQTPKDSRTLGFQLILYRLRFRMMIDALAHLFNTGQGVVMERSPFSDYVFVEAMAKAGYITPKGRDFYYELRRNTIEELQRPHLVIYLDAPVPVVQQRIKERKLPHEVNAPALTTEYLNNLERAYKYSYLQEASKHSELLVYDWSEQGDMEVVVEDVERVDFDKWSTTAHKYDPMLEDWKNMKEFEWAQLRYKYTNAMQRQDLEHYFIIPRWDVPEIIVESHHEKEWEAVWDEAPGNKYAKGFNADMGDSGVLFKYGRDPNWILPLAK